jgi:3-oxocholest-4-en-26-oate---CoA ligase
VEFNLADLFERAVDHFGDREYLVAEGERRTYAEMEARANQLAHHLQAQGVAAGDHVGIYALNSVQWVEALWAIFKLRAVWININYRYVEDELAYLFRNADLVALLHQAEFSDRVNAVQDALPGVGHTLVMDAPEYEEALASQSPERDFEPRSPDDRYILYTGGTTGMPKGVVWRQEDVFFALGGGIDPLSGHKVTRPEERADAAKDGFPLTFLPVAPLMHGASQWAVMGQSFVGNKIVLVPKFDPAEVWHLVEREKVNSIMITGDAMGRPLIEALADVGDGLDLSSLISLTSSAAIFSPSVKDQFLARFPNLIMTDAVGSSETGTNGITRVEAGHTAMKGGPTVTRVGEAVVLDDDLKPVEPGSGVIGRIATTGHIPLGYYNDEAKTAQTFVTAADGRRYSMPGDFATVEEDGSITLLGRGSVSINSGGEKIFPEEVEAAVKSHPDVWDAVVVGVPDERWGETVAAVVQPRPGAAPTLEAIQDHCRRHLAGYKVPRQVALVDTMQRSPSGKADYPWAKQVATGISA